MQLGDLFSAFFDDPVLIGIVVVLLTFVVLTYLFLRRTVTAFREGMRQDGRR